MLSLTLTEPVWLLFLGGLGVATWRAFHQRLEWRDLLPVLLWFLLPFTYVLLRRPPMYDGFRHFLFILPPVFVFIALAFQALFERLRNSCASFTLSMAWALLAPSAMAALVACRLSSTSFSTPSKAFWVRPNMVSMLALWAAAICSAVSMGNSNERSV